MAAIAGAAPEAECGVAVAPVGTWRDFRAKLRRDPLAPLDALRALPPAAPPAGPADLRSRARSAADEMSGAILIESGDIADLDAIMTVMEDSFDPRFGEAWTASQCAGLLPMAGVWLNLARVDGAVSGFSLARAVVGEAELLLLAVRRFMQGRGIGKALLARFAEDAHRRGATRLHLEVREGNHALRLYEAEGYTLSGRRRNYYSGHAGRCYDALTLAKATTN